MRTLLFLLFAFFPVAGYAGANDVIQSQIDTNGLAPVDTQHPYPASGSRGVMIYNPDGLLPSANMTVLGSSLQWTTGSPNILGISSAYTQSVQDADTALQDQIDAITAAWMPEVEVIDAIAAREDVLQSEIEGKENAITSGTSAQYWRGDKSWATFPTTVSTFTNDAGYATTTALTSGLSTKEGTITAGTTGQYYRGDKTWTAFPTAVSTFSNDAGYITSSALSGYLTSATAASTYATSSALSTGLSGKFNSPSGTTAQYLRGDGSLATFPTNNTAFTNGAGYLTSEVDGSVTNEIELPTQTGQSGKVLTTNGTSPSWTTASAGTVTSVSGTAPISVATGTTTPVISILAATTSAAGSLSAADKAKLDSIAEEQRAIVTVAGGSGRVTWTYPTAYGSGVVPIIQAAAVKPTSATTVSYNTAIYGDPTNSTVTIEVTAINNNITGILALIGVGTPAPNGTKVHLLAKAP